MIPKSLALNETQKLLMSHASMHVKPLRERARELLNEALAHELETASKIIEIEGLEGVSKIRFETDPESGMVSKILYETNEPPPAPKKRAPRKSRIKSPKAKAAAKNTKKT